MKYITKKAYINGLAARGCLRYLAMQKLAEQESAPKTDTSGTKPQELDSTVEAQKTQPPIKVVRDTTSRPSADPKEREAQKQRYEYLNWEPAKPEYGYAYPGLAGASIMSVIGALVQAARQKNILLGAGIGAGVGGLAGIGAKYYNDNYIYPKVKEDYEKSDAGPYIPPTNEQA